LRTKLEQAILKRQVERLGFAHFAVANPMQAQRSYHSSRLHRSTGKDSFLAFSSSAYLVAELRTIALDAFRAVAQDDAQEETTAEASGPAANAKAPPVWKGSSPF
jgi:hypothetical protein